MRGAGSDEASLFHALQESGARVLLIGRRAMIVLGIPVLTADYDLWAHGDDLDRLNAALAPLDLFPNHPPAEARRRGRYVLENDDHIDVLVARRQATAAGDVVSFDDVWARRVEARYDERTVIAVPEVDDLIRTKKWAMRPRDVTDIQLLQALKTEGKGDGS